jgi:hypothetical protein
MREIASRLLRFRGHRCGVASSQFTGIEIATLVA